MVPSWLSLVVRVARKILGLVVMICRIVQDAHEWSQRKPAKDAVPAGEAPPAVAEAPTA